MDPYWKNDTPNYNGMNRMADGGHDRKARRNYKLIIDPALQGGPEKLYRFDGDLPEDPTPVMIRDPRSRYRRYLKREVANLPVPKFTYDIYYVGTPLPKEVTFTNLNDNINSNFLEDMCKAFGNIEEVQIFTHPKTRKHLGVGRVLFTSTRAARACAGKLDQVSRMGKIMTVFVDTMGKERQRILEEMTAEQVPLRPPSPDTPRRRSDPRAPFLETSHPPHRNDSRKNDYHKEPRGDEHGMPDYHSADKHVPDHRRKDHRGNYHRGNDHARSHHHDNHYSHTPQSADLGYGSTLSDTTFTGSVSEQSSFISTPQTPHTPHTPQTPHGGFDNHYGQYGMAQNMGYNMNMPPSMNQNLQQPGMPPPVPHMQHPHSLPPPPVNMNQGYGGQYGMPPAPHQSAGGYEQAPPPHPQQHNQYHNSVHGHENFHRKERDRDRDRDRFRDRDRDRDDWRRERGDRGDRDRDRGNRRRDRDRDRDRERERERDRADRERGVERGIDRGTDRRSTHERFWSPPPPRAPSPEPEKQRVMSLESRIESLLRRNREEPAPAPVPVFGSGDEGSQGSGSSHGRREDYYEPQPPPCPQEQQAVPPLPMETPPPLPPPIDNLPPLPSRDELPPLPPLPPDMEAEAAALSLPSRHLNNSGNEHHPHSALSICDNTLSNPPLSVNYTEQAHCLYTDSQSAPPHTLHLEPNSDSATELPGASTPAGLGAVCTPDSRMATPCAADGTPVPEDTAMEDSDKADDDDDDRMSLSSISSGEQKLEVNVPKPPEQQLAFGSRGPGNFPDMSRPPPNFWPGAQQQQNFSGSFSGSFGAQGAGYGQSFNSSPAKPIVTMTPEDELREQVFIGVLQQVIKEMKDILQKDLCKRMVQSSAFKGFEKWWDTEADRVKPQRALDTGLSRTPVKSPRGLLDRKQAALAAPGAPPPGKTDSSSSISQLFENKEVGFGTNFGMGMGGLLGIRGGIPKLPSFRRKKFRPPSPPPEGEESQDVDVLRPPSPPPLESDEEDTVGKSDADELAEEGTPKSKARKLVIEDSDESEKSDSESEKGESEKESDGEEDEEDEVSVASSEEEEEEESDEATSEEDEVSELSSEEEEEEDTEQKAAISNEREDSAMDTSDVEAVSHIAEEKKEAAPAVDTETEEASEPMQEAVESAAESEPEVKVEESERSEAESIGKADEDEAMDTEGEDEEKEEEDEEEEDEDEKEEEAEKLAESLHESSENEESAKPEAPAETAKTQAASLSAEPELNHVKSELGNSEAEIDILEPDVVKKEPELAQTEPVRTENLVKQEAPIVKTEVAKAQAEESAGVVQPTQPEIKKELVEDESAERKEAERTTSIDTLTDRERGAFDMLMELHHRQSEPPSTPETPGVVKDLITRPSLASPQEEVVQLDSGLEQDAVMALLQMHEPSRSVTIPTEFASPEPPESTPETEVLNEHNYFGKMTDKQQVDSQEDYDSDITDSASEGEQDLVATLPPEIQIDHGYCQAFHPVSKKSSERMGSALIDIGLPSVAEMEPHVTPPRSEDMIQDVEIELQEFKVEDKKSKKTKKERKKDKKLKDLTNLTTEIIRKEEVAPPPKPKPQLKPRTLQAEMQVMYDFLIRGIDEEDIALLKRRYDELLQDDSPQSYWLNDIHWVDHSLTHIPDPSPPKKKRKHSVTDEPLRKHKTGCSRTEGYYKITHAEKLKYLEHNIHVTESQLEGDQRQMDANEQVKKKAQQTREARSETRRIQNVLSSRGEEVSDLLKFNQLKFRRKHLKFAKSGIHDWGLFALEPIAAEEMVIEYVGQVIRHSMANMREKKYEAVGIGSSYLFRVDSENVIDATRCGNLARFINHSCNPNCYAKIISVESRRKIVIYSKRDINVNDEITYDYKFPIEDEKITCLCGAANCRGTLN